MLSQEILKLEGELQRLKKENEELRRLLGVEPSKPMDCQACVFFIQHYIEAGSGYAKTNDGHCIHKKNRMKNRKPDDKKCQYFELGKCRICRIE